jgi:hypothetical protein
LARIIPAHLLHPRPRRASHASLDCPTSPFFILSSSLFCRLPICVAPLLSALAFARMCISIARPVPRNSGNLLAPHPRLATRPRNTLAIFTTSHVLLVGLVISTAASSTRPARLYHGRHSPPLFMLVSFFRLRRCVQLADVAARLVLSPSSNTPRGQRGVCAPSSRALSLARPQRRPVPSSYPSAPGRAPVARSYLHIDRCTRPHSFRLACVAPPASRIPPSPLPYQTNHHSGRSWTLGQAK